MNEFHLDKHLNDGSRRAYLIKSQIKKLLTNVYMADRVLFSWNPIINLWLLRSLLNYQASIINLVKNGRPLNFTVFAAFSYSYICIDIQGCHIDWW